MFNLKSYFKDIKKQSMDLSIDLNIVKASDQKADENNKKFDEQFDILISKGISSLEKFALNSNSEKDNLKEAISFFNEAISFKKNRPESYFYLGYISYLLKEYLIAKNYVDVCSFIDPNFPNIQTLKNNILSSL